MRLPVRSERPVRRSAWPLVLSLALMVCALLPLAAPRSTAEETPANAAFEWPQWRDGELLEPLALSEVENRFARRFPGRIGRFRAGSAAITLRVAERPTRLLHPAADCYRGLGYRIQDARLERDHQSRLWRCFIARQNGQALRVCERIEAADGQSFTDTSAWYWTAALGRSHGPWLAITRAERL